MNYKPCIIIPIYNHKNTIVTTVERLSVYQYPIFIIDDGSDVATQQVLAMLAEQYAIHLHRLPNNSGKGAAVMHGILAAYAAGFSHALQIDADGQHDTNDVPRFIQCGSSHPNDVICGKPIYDTSVPKGRLYGRYITHFWVWVETLSFTIKDSMCGFRLYPLAETCALINSTKLPKRMDFDTAIVVRLAWRGVKFQNITTRVIYPPDGLSHFNMWRDNVRISKMHTILTCGMLLRLPLLLWRKVFVTNITPDHWSKLSERGSALGLKVVVTSYRLLGKRISRLLLYPVVAYFFLTGGKTRSASLDYLQRIYTFSNRTTPNPTWRASFQHMLAFAQSGLDKLSAWLGDIHQGQVTFPDRAKLDDLVASGRGALIIGSHLGNLEMTRALASVNRTVINAVVYTDHAQRFNQILSQTNAQFGVNLIQVSNFGSDTAIMLRDKIDRGELLVIVGDRTPPAENGRVCEVEFMGDTAAFAQGPFILASLLECPVLLLFCLPENNTYHIHLEHFVDKIMLPRAERQTKLRAYMQQYAYRLETYCLKAPYQWFNFYDFWQKPISSSHSINKLSR
ncbi:MAG TPA: glycosyltransferase [Methylotenera sp.]|nr:glycosyltransferase [Methylotenera sp.]